MRSVMLCGGIIVALLATACGKSEDKAVPAVLLPVPKCKVADAYDADSFERIVLAMDRSGDIAAMTTIFMQHRQTIEAQLAKRDPQLLQRLKPALDTQFSDERLRERMACAFVALKVDTAAVTALDAWASSPAMKAINTAIWTRVPASSKDKDETMTPSRKALLRNISAAMALQQIQANIDAVQREATVKLMAAIDPRSGPVQSAIVLPDDDMIVDRWLSPILAKIPDDDLAEYLKFAESSFGGDYYLAMSAAHDFQSGNWYTQLVDLFRQYNAPAAAAAGSPGKEALIADARRSLREVGGTAAAADAMAKLLEAQRLDPLNADIQALLGEAAIGTAPAMPLGQDQLRVVITTPNYDQANTYLLKALELAPQHADAHMLLGRLRYLQGNDDEASRLYELARAIEADHPSMDYYLGDLAHVKQDYAKASRYYQAAVSKPERIVHTHVNALGHLLVTLRKSSRAAEYPRIANDYLTRHPEASNFRLDYADYLLASDMPADKVLAVIEPVPDAWLPVRKVPTLSAALLRKASERLGKLEEPSPESSLILERVIGMNADPRALADAVCRADVKSTLAQQVMDASPDAKATATALVVCALRWRRAGILNSMVRKAQVAQLNQPQPELLGDTPLCYAAATKNASAFVAFAKMQLNPAAKCRDGNTVAERLQQMSFSGDPYVAQMLNVMNRLYKKS
jgi:tetratricopeptide (TPR) repeat protein